MTSSGHPSADEVDAFYADDQMLSWGRSMGLDLSDRDQLVDAAAVGLTVLLWRNTVLEEVHSGTTVGGVEPPGTIGLVGVADPAETDRIERVLDAVQVGGGLPDDVMMRANCSTVAQVRAVLGDVIDERFTRAGDEIPYDAQTVPQFVLEVSTVLGDPTRPVTVGATTFAAHDLFAGRWDDYLEDLYVQKPARLILFSDLLGQRRALWLCALTGVSYSPAWFPHSDWAPAVRTLRTATQPGELGEGPVSGVRLDEEFWEAAENEPMRLNGRQALWLMLSDLHALIDAARAARVAGPPPSMPFHPMIGLF